MTFRDKYQAFVSRLPAPGGGGAHTAIFAAGCHGARAGVSQEQVCADVRAHLPRGSREVSEREIEEGVRAGFASVVGGVETPPRPPPRVAPGTRERFIREGKGATEADIRARSPVRLDWPDEEGWRALEHLFGEDELVFCGDDRTPGRIGSSIRTRGAWFECFEDEGGATDPKLIPNPLTGEYAPKRSGEGETLRGDGNCSAFRYAVAESDSLPLEDQLAFWMGCPALPVAMLTFSGKKSVHALIRVDCRDAAEWDAQIAGNLFPGYLVPLGMDPACKNPARLTRMPGFCRPDTNQIQRCIYLAPEGKAVAA
jgi:hypothetical protein